MTIKITISQDEKTKLFDFYIDQDDQFFAFSFADETEAINFKRRSIELFSTVDDVYVQPEHAFVEQRNRDNLNPPLPPKRGASSSPNNRDRL